MLCASSIMSRYITSDKNSVQSVRVTINPIYSDHDERVRQKRVIKTLAAHDLKTGTNNSCCQLPWTDYIHFPNKCNGWYTVTLRGNA